MKTVLAMPVRQVESTLPRVFEALSTLDPQPGRYLFLENNSSDNTLNLLREFDAPKEIIRLWFLDGFEVPDSWAGVSIARHFLLKRARQLNPDFTLFLDADVIPSRSDLITVDFMAERFRCWCLLANIIRGRHKI